MDTQGSSKSERIGYFAGPILSDIGVGWYMVVRIDGVQVNYFAQEAMLAEDDPYVITEVLPDGKFGRAFSSPVLCRDDITYDYTQVSEGQYDTCKCGNPKAACVRRCPMCLHDRRARRQAFAQKVIKAYKAEMRRRRQEARRAARRETRRMEAELNNLRPQPIVAVEPVDWVSPVKTLIGKVTSWWPRRESEPEQLALPLFME